MLKKVLDFYKTFTIIDTMVESTKQQFQINQEQLDNDYRRHNINNEYALRWFLLLTFRENRVVIYGQGEWYYHIMDWRGCNHYHGRLPGSPTFKDEREAIKWLKWAVESGYYTESMRLTGHHSGESECSAGCDDREIGGCIHFHDLEKKDIEQIYRRSVLRIIE
jgi:hypothetical protein